MLNAGTRMLPAVGLQVCGRMGSLFIQGDFVQLLKTDLDS